MTLRLFADDEQPPSDDDRAGDLAKALRDLMTEVSRARIMIRVGSPLDKAWRRALKLLDAEKERDDAKP